MPLTPQDFISKWKRVTSREKQTYQEHFIDLCRLAGHQTPNDYDSLAHALGLRWGGKDQRWTRQMGRNLDISGGI